MERKPRTRIIIRLEKDGKYIERSLNRRIVCDLFDLQFMLDDIWNTIKLNKMEKGIVKFFEVISLIDDAMHGDMIGRIRSEKYHIEEDKKGNIKMIKRKPKLVRIKKKNEDYPFGRPKWKKIK